LKLRDSNVAVGVSTQEREPLFFPSVLRQSTTPKAGDFYIFSVAGTDRCQRESFLGFQAAHDFILRLGAQHDIDRITRVAVAGRRGGRAQEDVNDKRTHGLSHVRRVDPILTAPRRLSRCDRSVDRFLTRHRSTSQIPCHLAPDFDRVVSRAPLQTVEGFNSLECRRISAIFSRDDPQDGARTRQCEFGSSDLFSEDRRYFRRRSRDHI
jgi:hypothetical protein